MTTPDTIALRPAPNAEPAAGFPLDHPYVEHVWAAAVGPTSTLLLRRTAVLFRAFPDGLEVEALDFGQSLGLSSGSADHLSKTLERLDRFELASWDGEAGVLAVPSHVRPVPGRILQRMPSSTRAVHGSLIGSVRSVARPLAEPSLVPAPGIERPSLGLEMGA